MELLLLLWVVCGIGAAAIASARGANGCLWFGLGMLFGPFGIIFAFLAGDTKRCPQCASQIPGAALRCPKCQIDLSGSAGSQGNDPRTERLIELLKSGAGDESFRCPACKTGLRPGVTLCPTCGGAINWPTVPPVPPSTKKCPFCAETILAAAKKCKHCGEFLDRSEAAR